MTETCPVCGWTHLREDYIPANPDPEHGPDAHGILYVHRWESTGNGRVEIDGCSEYETGETNAWTPPDQ